MPMNTIEVLTLLLVVFAALSKLYTKAVCFQAALLLFIITSSYFCLHYPLL